MTARGEQVSPFIAGMAVTPLSRRNLPLLKNAGDFAPPEGKLSGNQP